MNLGTDHDTSAFAVESYPPLVEYSRKAYIPRCKSLYINCDGEAVMAGAHGYGNMSWHLFAQETGIEVHVSHYPPETSKWNKIEHRLFCYITKTGQENRSWTLILLSI